AQAPVAGEMAQKRGRPASRHDGVVVEEDQGLAPGCGEAGVGSRRVAAVVGKENRADPRVARRGSFQQLARAVGRAVVDGEDLEVRPLRAGEEAVEAESV